MERGLDVNDLLIIGAGFWGAAVALKARAAGLNITILDSQEPGAASVNSDAIIDPAAYARTDRLPPGWRERVPASIEWACGAFGARPVPGIFWNQYQGRAPRPTRDLVAVDLGFALPKFRAWMRKITHLQWDGEAWCASGGHRSRRVALCAGAWVDDILVASGLPPVGVSRLFGRGWVVEGEPRPEVGLERGSGRVLEVMTAPYVKVMVRGWPGDRWQVGSTAERTPDAKHRERLLRVAGMVFEEGWTIVDEMQGWRPVTPQCVVREVAPGLVVATGGHRMGLGLAGLVGEEVLRLFGLDPFTSD